MWNSGTSFNTTNVRANSKNETQDADKQNVNIVRTKAKTIKKSIDGLQQAREYLPGVATPRSSG